MRLRLVIMTLMAAAVMALAPPAAGSQGSGPATPNFILQAILRPSAAGLDNGFGLVKFRQPKDAEKVVYLDVWVRDLAPNHSYLLQRAVDTSVDDDCTTATSWLTLGEGLVLPPQAITTDDRGIGRAQLFRDLATVPLGLEFDIHFRVIDAMTSAVVLQSGCYQFTVSR